jgi:hypothetical protein
MGIDGNRCEYGKITHCIGSKHGKTWKITWKRTSSDDTWIRSSSIFSDLLGVWRCGARVIHGDP